MLTLKNVGKFEEESKHEKKDRELFNKIAQSYCRKDILPVSRIARKQRLRKTFSLLPRNTEFRVLEVGCGCGFSACYLEGLYSTYVGIDYAESLIKYAREYNSSDNIVFHTKNISNYFPEKKFDVIFMIGVLHHFDELEKSVLHILTMLKPGGWLLANEPQPSNLIIQLARKIRYRIDSSYSADQITLSTKELYNLYENVGLQNIIIIPQGIFSTPFAEVIVKPQFFFKPIVYLTVFFDNLLEGIFGRLLTPFSWNLIAAGQKAAPSAITQLDVNSIFEVSP